MDLIEIVSIRYSEREENLSFQPPYECVGCPQQVNPMIIFSSMMGFANPDEISLKPFDSARLFGPSMTLRESVAIPIRALSEGSDTLILVHGINNSWPAITHGYMTIAENVRNYSWTDYQRIIGYAWPGGESSLSYHDAKQRTDTVSIRFANVLRTLLKHNHKVGILAHSMGSLLALKAVDNLAKSEHAPGGRINLYMTAAAVKHNDLHEKFIRAVTLTHHTVVFYSRNDPVLAHAYATAEGASALGCSGPGNRERLPDSVTTVDCSRLVKSHDGYETLPELYRWLASAGAWEEGAPQLIF